MTTHAQHDHTESNPVELDAWHQHPAADGLPQTEHGSHANITVLLVTFVTITVATVAFSVIIAVYAINQMNNLLTEREVQGLAVVAPEAAAYKQDALAAQTGYSWTADGAVMLPIEQAMQLVLQESGSTTHQEETPKP
ncbi:MAG: hypothetical protein Q9O74_02270 [Planctomycetota bacterium]|nr:hypothetical protein [Planctomycetota bacterium]